MALPGADHLLSETADSHYVGAVIAAWAARYLGAKGVLERVEEEAEGEVVVRTGRARYHTEILAGGHGLVADEPVSVGGTDTGPHPFGLLLAALGSCVTITLRMYADRKEWPLEEIGVQLEHRKLSDDEAPRSESGAPRREAINQTLQLIGPLDEEQRERLLEIAHRCPVHRALEAGAVLRMDLEESGA